MIEAVLIGLAGWRLANFLVEEDGPYDIFEYIRQKVGVVEGEVTGFFPRLFTCVYCMTVWTSLLCYLLWEMGEVVVIILASMAVAIIASKLGGN